MSVQGAWTLPCLGGAWMKSAAYRCIHLHGWRWAWSSNAPYSMLRACMSTRTEDASKSPLAPAWVEGAGP
eukprot:14828797-Alexandrium_andersonii.AAC.1